MTTTRNRWVLIAFALGAWPAAASAAPAMVSVFEAQVHAAPDRSSPVIHTFAENTQVSVSETTTNGFRKVRLPNGKVGYIENSDVTLAGPEATGPETARPPNAPPSVQPPGPPPSVQPPPPPFGGAPPPPPPPPPPGWVPYRRVVLDPTAFRHVGPYLRLELGLGYLSTSTSTRAASFIDSAHGFAGDFAFSLGGAVKENFILAGQFWGSWAAWPTLSSGGVNFNTGGSFTTSVYGIGPNFTWYLMPANVLFSVTPSLTWVDFGNYYSYYGSYSSDAGFGTRFTVAKEWWVAPHWSIGVSGWFLFSFNGVGSGLHGTWDTYAGGIGFTTSMN